MWEEEIEKEIEQKFQRMRQEAQDQLPLKITREGVEKCVKKLKMKKADDNDGYVNEMLKYGGKEMVVSLWMMFNRISREGKIPTQCESMRIKSLYKNKGSRQEMKNGRGYIPYQHDQ